MSSQHAALAAAPIRALGCGIVALALTTFAGTQDRPEPSPTRPFAELLIERAADLATREHEPPATVDAHLAALDYDRYRRIRLRPERRIWAEPDGNFQLEPLHVGGLYRHPVELSTLVDGQATPITFAPDAFDYDGLFPDGPTFETAGFSGLRIRWPLNRPEVQDEFLVFQGASYFRAVSRGLDYGTSARGLAIRTADTRGEEFPRFRAFWVERPEPGSQSVRLHALLDSESVTGAFTFLVTPGDETTIDVTSTLFARRELESYGIAPLTSMFLFSAINRSRFDDFRRAVHDANGLQMVTGTGTRLWRPLDNPTELEISNFLDADPKGFGLTQRPRDFEDYQDLEARYDRRPSVWVEPLMPFGKGSVTLVEIPTEAEFHDNIAAFWKPEQPLVPGTPSTWRYRLHFGGSQPDVEPFARVAATYAGAAPNNGNRVFAVDFLEPDGVEGQPALIAEATAGEIVNTRLDPVPGSAKRRAMVEFAPGDADAAEFRIYLTRDDEPCSEVWLHRWNR